MAVYYVQRTSFTDVLLEGISKFEFCIGQVLLQPRVHLFTLGHCKPVLPIAHLTLNSNNILRYTSYLSIILRR